MSNGNLRQTHVLHLSPTFDHAIVLICAFIGIPKVYTNAKRKLFFQMELLWLKSKLEIDYNIHTFFTQIFFSYTIVHRKKQTRKKLHPNNYHVCNVTLFEIFHFFLYVSKYSIDTDLCFSPICKQRRNVILFGRISTKQARRQIH